MDNVDRCECGRARQARCPACGAFVEVIKSRLKAHESATCTGSHMQYGSCSGSGKPAGER